jgi:hypothetical protein
MGTKYSTVAISGYNSSPPPDDGSTGSDNQITWAKHKTKIGDPIKTAVESINSQLVTALDKSARSISSSDSTVASDHDKVIEIASTVSTSVVTLSLADAASMANGYLVTVVNRSAYDQTIGRVTTSDGINGTATNVTIPSLSSLTFAVNSDADGYNTKAKGDAKKIMIGTGDNPIIDTAKYTGDAPVAQVVDVRKGTSGSADSTTEPMAKFSRTISFTSSSFGGTDGSEEAYALGGVCIATAACHVQPVGVFGGARTASTQSASNDDACGVFGQGITSGTGLGIGGYFEGRRSATTASGYSGVEAKGSNRTANNLTYSGGTAPSGGVGVRVCAAGNSGVSSSTAIEIYNDSTCQWDVGIAVLDSTFGGASPVISSTLRDDGSAAISIDVRGSHTTAAIKVANSSGKTVLGESNDVYIGASSSIAGSSGVERRLQVSSGNGITNFRWSADGNAAALDFCKSRSATVGTHAVLQSGDTIGNITFSGSDGDQFHSAAQIIASVDGTPGDNDMPGALEIKTSEDGTTTLVSRIKIGSQGNVILNNKGAALATNATGGFTYIPSCPGTPSGTPAVLPTGAVPIVWDSTNNMLMVYDGSWLGATNPGAFT